jgi:GDP-4-dehydro-6-deoxy-D-mannose reductase
MSEAEKKSILITGSTGMVGSHFVNAYREKGWEVFGLARPSASSRLYASDDYHVFRVDLLDATATARVVEKVKPDVVVHMAAQAFNGTSWEMESYTHLCNFNSTLNLLNACRLHVPESKILLACSSAEYGCVDPEDCPLEEDRPLKPVTPYGVSKMATEALGFQYFSNYGMQVYLPRMFIHVGTGHPPATAIQNFARQVASIQLGKMDSKMEVGRLDTARDFIDVRDGVSAMVMLLDKGEAGIPINICTQEAWKIGEILDMLCNAAGIQPTIEQCEKYMRPSDELLLLGDATRLRELGWQRKYSMQETLDAVVKDWLERLSHS